MALPALPTLPDLDEINIQDEVELKLERYRSIFGEPPRASDLINDFLDSGYIGEFHLDMIQTRIRA